MSISALREAYEGLFTTWYELHRYPERPSSVIQSVLQVKPPAQDGIYTVAVAKDSPAELTGFPTDRMKGAVNRKRQLGANLAFTQQVKLGEEGIYQVVLSRIYLTYWKRWPDREYHLMDKWRFEFDAQPHVKIHHPLYHAQLCADDGAAAPPEHIGSRGSRHLSVPRVPTAPMSLSAVLEMIMIDHFPGTLAVPNKLQEWRAAVDRLPKLGPGPCPKHSDPAHLNHASRCWYPSLA